MPTVSEFMSFLGNFSTMTLMPDLVVYAGCWPVVTGSVRSSLPLLNTCIWSVLVLTL